MREMPSDLAFAHVVREHAEILSLESDRPATIAGWTCSLFANCTTTSRRNLGVIVPRE